MIVCVSVMQCMSAYKWQQITAKRNLNRKQKNKARNQIHVLKYYSLGISLYSK